MARLIILYIVGGVLQWIVLPSMSAQKLEAKQPAKEDTSQYYEMNPCGLNEVICEDEKHNQAVLAVQPISGTASDNGGTHTRLGVDAYKAGRVAVISFYSAIDSCHTGKSCLMANGKRAAVGYVACPRNIPLGTKIHIDTLGDFECGDRTARFVDGRWDIFTGYGEAAYKEAIKNGLKRLKVTIL